MNKDNEPQKFIELVYCQIKVSKVVKNTSGLTTTEKNTLLVRRKNLNQTF